MLKSEKHWIPLDVQVVRKMSKNGALNPKNLLELDVGADDGNISCAGHPD